MPSSPVLVLALSLALALLCIPWNSGCADNEGVSQLQQAAQMDLPCHSMRYERSPGESCRTRPG